MPNQSKIDFEVLGSVGLKQFSGYIDEEFHPKLKGLYGAKVYREMSDNSSTIGAILFLFEHLTRQVDWRVEPANDVDSQALDWAAFLEQCLEDMEGSFEDFISEALSFLIYGWAYFEKVLKIRRGPSKDPKFKSRFDDGRIGWRSLSLRSQDTLDFWEFDDNGNLLGLNQWDQSTGKKAYIPLEKAIHFTTKKYKNNPEGRSIFRNAVIDYFYLKRISQIEAIGIERDLAGLPVMQVPLSLLRQNASAEDVALRGAFEKMLAEIKNDERAFALIPTESNPDGSPTGYKFSLLSTGGSRQFDTTRVKESYKTSILQSVVAQFLQLGMGSVGSFALASSQTNLFSVALGSFLDVLTETFNKQAVIPLMELNGCPPEMMPYMVHGDIESPPLDELGRYIQVLAAAGQLPESDTLRRKLLEFANLPVDLEEGEPSRETRRPLRGVGAPTIGGGNNA